MKRSTLPGTNAIGSGGDAPGHVLRPAPMSKRTMPSTKNAGGPSAEQLRRSDVNKGTVRGYIPGCGPEEMARRK